MMRRIGVWLCLWFACSVASADDAPRTMLRAHLEPAGPVVAGSAVQLVVDALTTTWFTAAPDWPLFDVPDAFVTLPDENAQNLNETIDGVRWFGVSRAYHIVPRTAGAFDIPSFSLSLHPGGTDAPVTLHTPAFQFSATLPPGAEHMKSFFPTPKLTVAQRIEPHEGTLDVGATITRTITQRAEATDSMLIAPVQFAEIEGLRRYPKIASTRDLSEDRTGLVAGERTDSVTYVVNRRGRFALPPVDIEWWNTATQQREVIHLPGVHLTARTAHEKPLWQIPADAMSGAARHTVIFLSRTTLAYGAVTLIAIFAAGLVYRRLRAGLERVAREWRACSKRRAEGEFAAWRDLRHAVHEGHVERIVPRLYRWMDANPRFARPARLAAIERGTDPALMQLAQAAEAHYGPLQQDEGSFRVKLRARDGRRRLRMARESALPPLNSS